MEDTAENKDGLVLAARSQMAAAVQSAARKVELQPKAELGKGSEEKQGSEEGGKEDGLKKTDKVDDGIFS
jgi:hypothetical protein